MKEIKEGDIAGSLEEELISIEGSGEVSLTRDRESEAWAIKGNQLREGWGQILWAGRRVNIFFMREKSPV